MYPHRIRLREPWEREPLDGGMRYHRFFNAPTIVANEAVWIVCDGLHSEVAFSLNGSPLTPLLNEQSFLEVDATPHLAPRNALVIDLLSAPADADALPWTEVRLEIRRVFA